MRFGGVHSKNVGFFHASRETRGLNETRMAWVIKIV